MSEWFLFTTGTHTRRSITFPASASKFEKCTLLRDWVLHQPRSEYGRERRS